jgi:hypothetical protein
MERCWFDAFGCIFANIAKLTMQKLKTIIFGTERKAEIFNHLFLKSEKFELTGFYDPDDEMNFNGMGGLLYTANLLEKGDVFVVDRHTKRMDSGVIENLIRFGKHILFDGFHHGTDLPVEQFCALQSESRNCIQIANVLHNKPLFTTAAQHIRKPRFIKLEKHCPPPAPGEFYSWLFEMLGQDLDLIVRVADSEIRNVSARPIFLFGKNPDLLNIHIEFDNDAVCHISAGRAIEPGLHRLRFFQENKVCVLDFPGNTLTEYRPADNQQQLNMLNDNLTENSQEFSTIVRPVMPFDTWQMELRNFAENIEKHLTPRTSLYDWLNMLNLTQKITEKVQRRYHEV